jgi:hypothetical protein
MPRPRCSSALVAALTASPIFLYAIIGIILMVVLFLMISSARQKEYERYPGHRVSLAKKLGRGKGAAGPVIAVADDEPVPTRKPAAPGYQFCTGC